MPSPNIASVLLLVPGAVAIWLAGETPDACSFGALMRERQIQREADRAFDAVAFSTLAACPFAGSSSRDRLLLLAIAGVEASSRGPLDRHVEEAIGRAILTLTGRLPDFSYGMLQIRPSALRRAGALPDANVYMPVLERLIAPCEALALAGQLVLHQREGPWSPDFDATDESFVRQAASFYNTGRWNANAGRHYADVVLITYRRLSAISGLPGTV